MKIALATLLAATVATTAGSAFAQQVTVPSPAEVIPAGVPLRVELNKSYRMRVGTRLEGHLTEPVYLIDHVVIPADSKVYGEITGRHGVSRQVRTAAMFNGDLTPLKNAEVTFTGLETPDGRHFDMKTDVTERTTQTVRMAAPEEAVVHRSFGQKIAAAFRWTRRETAAGFEAPHKWDKARQTLYAQVPVHPQEVWVGTQYDAELTQPLELAGQAAPTPEVTADLTELKLNGDIEARLVDPVDSSTATAGMPVEAVLTQPLFETEPAAEASTEAPVLVASLDASSVAPGFASAHLPAIVTSDASTRASVPAHRKLLLPEGTHLIGSVVEASPAGMFGHNGSLRMTFRKVELPEGDTRVIHGRVIATESVKNDRIQIDNEGQMKASGGNRFLATITVGSLAAASDGTGAGLMREALTTNGLNLLTRVIGQASSNAGLISGFGYYEVGKVVFDTWIAKGHEVVFAKNTRMEIELAQR